MNEIITIFDDIFNNNDIFPEHLADNDIFKAVHDLILLTYKQYTPLDSNKLNEIKLSIDKCIKLKQNTTEQPHYSESTIEYLKNKIKFLEKIPQPEQRTEEWYLFRENRLTASDFYNVIEKKESAKRNELILKKCGIDKPFMSNAATAHGIKFEPLATSIYEKRTDTIILEFGCLPHPHISYFGASPDGIVSYDSNNKNYIGRMLEIKCPKSRIITGIIPDGYYAQMQGQLEVCDLEYCDFLECDFQMYKNKDAFYNDIREDKGIIIELFDSNIKKPVYHYCEEKHIKNKDEFERWEETIIDSIFKEENNHLEYTATTFWYLNKYNVVLVKRDRDYFNKHFMAIKSFWDEVLHYRKIGIDSLLSKKKKKTYIYKEPEFDFIN